MGGILQKSRWYILGLLILVLGTVPLWGTDYILLFCLLFCLYLAFSQMWNLLTGVLVLGATPLIYDGNPGYPNMDMMWELTDRSCGSR